MNFSLIAEGYMEESIAVRLLPFCGHELGTVYGQHGCSFIRQNATKFQHLATEQTGVLVLTDFRDARTKCIPDALLQYIHKKMPEPPETFLCRFAVNEIESWLLADAKGMSGFLGIAVSRVPIYPEDEANPKRTLVDLARSSRNKKIREGIAPPPGHHANVGPEYMSLMREFISSHWNIEAALHSAPSLERCIRRLCELPCNICKQGK